MDNGLKAFEVGNGHLYAPAQAQTMVSLSTMKITCCTDTFPSLLWQCTNLLLLPLLSIPHLLLKLHSYS